MKKIFKFSNPFYDFFLERKSISEINFIPENLWTGDSENGRKIIDGSLQFNNETIVFRPNSWRSNNGSKVWNEKLHSFEWVNDVRTVGTNKVQSILGCIFLPIGFMILIIFTAVGLYDSKMGGVFVIQPAIFITIGLCFTFIPNKTRVSFDRNTRTYTIETSKYWYPCLGKKVYNGSFDEIKNASSVTQDVLKTNNHNTMSNCI